MCWKVVFAALDEKANTSLDVASAVQKGTLLNFHKCLGHLNFDAVKRLARDRSSCIERIVHKNVNRLISAQAMTKAMAEVLQALQANEVWEVVKMPRGVHMLHTKWVHKTKLGAESLIEQ
ncbi:hypothetical protein L915_10761 [Phytophthora nicotianae]|uniref:GAG-pre-integrase domain-containing protein n=1 Tax=Phytophthora nicotianae TaxID=4792 RepID=W2GPM2_PHYNI|nr:hypothetical protein L915_10761 [Phytophthora nicotianae]